MSVEDLLHHIRKEAGDDDDYDGEPGRTAGQQLDKDEVHVLGVQEWPAGSSNNTVVKKIKFFKTENTVKTPLLLLKLTEA